VSARSPTSATNPSFPRPAIVKAGRGKLGFVAEAGDRADTIHAAAVEWVAKHTPAPEPSGASEETSAPA